MSREFDEVFDRPTRWTERTNEVRSSEDVQKEVVVGSGAYKAYGYTPADDLETCDVGWWLPDQIAQGHIVQYRFLLAIHYIGEGDIRLHLSDGIVRIEGERLFDLRKRLARRRVTFVQCFNPLVWPEKPPADEPLVTKITLLYPGEEHGRQ